MNAAIIDIGSNTVRLSIYEVKDKSFEPLLSKKEMTGLAGYIQNGSMSEEGIARACAVLMRFKEIIEHFHIEKVYVLATAPFRNIDNTDQCLEKIKEVTGFDVDAISGEKEALLDFDGATLIHQFPQGLLIDIGGGSTELVCFKEGEILEAISLPIGSLSLYNAYCDHILPTEKQYSKMKKHVEKLLEFCSFIETQNCDEVIGVGGTIRACNKLYRRENHLENNVLLSYKDIKNLYKKFEKQEGKAYRMILKTVPERIHTLIPGLIILKTVMQRYGCQNLYVSEYGVREGYLSEKIKEGHFYE